MKETEEVYIETGLEIAVIGMAGRFPGAKNTREFWANLRNGVDSISFFNEEELAEINPELRKNPNFVKAKGGVLENYDCFDAFFFNYTPTEAELMAPSMRVFHECAWEALEDSGYVPGHYRGAIGLYAGIQSTGDWEALCRTSTLIDEVGAFSAAGLSNRDFMSTLVAYKLNLKGPTFSVNTACSTSLVAIHLACQGLLSGDCRMALAGGVAVRFPRPSGYLYEEGMIDSPDGHTRSFDAAAGGTTGGDGAGVVVLKQLGDAISDGDYIYAVIKGSAINNDGNRKVGYTAPSVEGQAEAIRNAYKAAEINPEDIGYIEAHGTATLLGDVTEVEALKIAFNTKKRHFCRLGTVKSNMGHLDIAAGITGFIKTVLVLKNKQIPPLLHFQKPNPAIDFENSPFYINTSLETWENNGKPLRAGVSSFGIGGTNAHVVLEEYTQRSEMLLSKKENSRAVQMKEGAVLPAKTFYYLIILSAKTQSTLDKITENLGQYLKENPDANLVDIAYTLQIGRKHFPYRRKLVSNSIQDTIAKLSSPDSRNTPSNQLTTDEKARNVIFMFPGLGSQYPNMGLDLYQTEPIFKEAMDHCFEILKSLGYDLKKILFLDRSDGSYESNINKFDVAQLATFAIEYALAKLLMAWGIRPHAMIGYSFGEYAAACISGVFTLEDILRLLVARGKLISELPPGIMLSIPLPVNEVSPLLPDQLAIAIDNGSSCVISGAAALVKEFEKDIKKKKIICLPLDASHAIHSPMMGAILNIFEKETAKIALNPPKIPYISTVTGNWIKVEDAISPNYWARQLRETVCFDQGIQNLRQESDTVFLEVGPGRDISALVEREINENRENGDRQKNPVIHLIRQAKKQVPDDYYLLDKIGLLWLHGVQIDWRSFHKGKNRRRVPLPTYPFEKHRFWRIPGQPLTIGAIKQDSTQVREFADFFYTPSWKQTVSPQAHPPLSPEKENAGGKINNHYLVFLDQDEKTYQGRFARNLVHRLRQKRNQVITIAVGEVYSHQSQGKGEGDDHHYIMNPTRKEDYEIVIRDICARGLEKFPAVIIHLWTLGPGDSAQTGKSYFQRQQDVGYYSLLYLVQALVKERVAKNAAEFDDNSLSLRIEILSDHLHAVPGDEDICAEKAPITGLCKTIPQEYPNITCRSIDIKIPAALVDGSPAEVRLMDRLMSEFTTLPQDLTVAYRGNSRWVQYYEPFRLQSRDGDPVLLRHNGVYLITGGLGNDSFIRARYLAETFHARLVLTGRTPLPDRDYWSQYLMLNGDQDPLSIKIKRVQELESLGVEILVLGADVSDELDMRLAMQEVEQRFGVLNGVIHAAGITDISSSKVLMELGREESEWHFQPKVYGLYVLEKILAGRNLDFCLLTSSIASLTAGIGLSAYTASSIFMDAFARRKNINGNSFPWIALNWVGSDPGETVEAFKRVMSVEGLEQVVFFQGDLQQLIRERIELKTEDGKARLGMGTGAQGANGKSETGPVYERPALSTPYLAPRNEAEQKLADIWQRFFGIDKIGVNDDIIDLGGDSLKAMNILAIVQKELNFSIPLREFFDNPTIEGAAKYIASAEPSTVAESGVFVSIEPAEEKEYYVLTSAQRRMYLFQQMNPEDTAYNSPVVMVLEGNLDKEKMEWAFKALIERHEMLRTSIIKITEDQEPVQKVYDYVEFEIKELGAREEIEAIIKSFVQPFDLSKAPLMRVGLIKVDENKHLLLEDMHHIITDAVSIDLFAMEFNVLYGGGSLPALRLQYRDYAEWQNSERQRQAAAGQEAYWVRQFENDMPVLELPSDFPRPAEKNYEGRSERFELGRDEFRGIKALGASCGATLFMTLLALLNVFLAKLSGKEDIVIGTPAAGRGHVDLEKIIGVFINTLALRNRVEGQQAFKDFLRKVKGQSLEAFENETYPFEALVEKVSLERDMSRNPLFDVLFLFQSAYAPNEDPDMQEVAGLTIRSYDYDDMTAKFDLTFMVLEKEDSLKCTLEYCTRLFKEETIRRFIACYKKLVSSVIASPGQLISAIEIIPDDEKQSILYEFNNTWVDYPGDKTIHQLFEEQVERTPDRVGVVGPVGQVGLTYRQLNEQSNRLAGLLSEKGMGLDAITAIMMERSVEMVIGIFGILKAGGAYLPIEPDYPRERIDYMLKDSGARLLINEKFFGGLWRRDDFSKKPPGNVQLAYVIYTSGSTGLPKGTAVEHGAVVNLLFAMQRKYPLLEKDAYLLKTSYMFDVSVTELFGWFFEGGKLVILEKDGEKDPNAILANIERHYITHINFVPPMFNAFIEIIGPGSIGKLSSLKYIFLAGEALLAELVERFRRYGLAVSVENIYGPTEGTVYSAWYSLGEWRGGSVPIGKPLPNVELLVLDRAGNLQPVGVPGELCMTGRGLARGYLNNPELTTERFIKNRSYRTNKTYIGYKTGDLARWLPDGNIEFLGRMDYQVKVRGFRIEMGEIEGQLLKHPGIKEAVVLVRATQTGDKSLCAYVVGDIPGGAEALRQYLSRTLPYYMVPTDFVFLERLPLNVSGKIDRKALPVPGIKTGAGYAAPVNTIEKKLLVIWSEVLGIDKSRIGVEDNFFLLGGHSLRAASMAARIHRELGFKIALTQVFKTSTIRGLTRALGLMNPDKYNTVEPAEEKEYYALSAAQKRLYILQCMDPANTGYNMPAVFYLEGNVDLAKLTKILIKLISRHESLKTSFIMVKGEPVQKIHHEVNFKIEQEQTITHFIRAFDLSTAPLLRVGLQKVEEEKFILLLDMHHIITDGASTAILINDLAGFYEGKELPLLNLHYRDFAEWQNRLLKSGDIKQQEAYWLKLYEDGLPVLELPGDYVRPKVRTFEGDTLYFEILEKEVAALKQMASGSNATLFQVFLTIYYILLAKLGGQEDFVVGTPVLGRTHPDLEQIIGMFVNTLALRNFPAAEKSFHEFLVEVKECVLKGYENQDYQFEDLVEKIVLQRDISRNPFFDVMFIFQEQSGIGIEVPGLKLTPYEYETKTARFDLALTVVESEDKFHMAFEHSTKLFKNETIKRFGEYFKRIAIAVTETPEAPLTAIEIISESEKKQVLFDFNDTAVEYPGDKTIHRLFEEQVERTPDRVAVIDSIDSTVETLRAMSLQNHITYRQLNEQSDRLARFLIEKGVLADSIVGIMLGRSIEMIIGIIGILKSGGAYLPIDPEYPQERINYMVKDSAAKILLTSSHHSSHIIHHSSYFAHHSNHLAYIIYTSGSSGKPKGVMIEHRSIINTLHWRKNQYCFDEKDATLQLPSFSFDSSVEDIFTPLISGSRLVLIHARQRFDVNYLKMLLVNLRVTHFLILPNLYRTYIDAIPESLRGMKTITVAGENFSEDLVKHHFERLSRVRLFNEYGPTENSVCSTVYEFTPGQTRILIGKPIANVNCYIVNPYWKLNPVGIPGELCVSGEGISRGYLNNPELTAEKFIDCHHLSFNIHHSKLYCTGDLARWLDDGSPADGAAKGVIEFLGRIDNQVKIRGFRIELGEIETRLLMHNKIKDAVVIADAAICAYIVPTAPETLNMSELREYLSGLLPAYMVPTFFVQLERIPLTPNGKINRRALPATDIRGAELKRTYVAPKTELEKSIAAAWKDILGVTEVGLHDNFFELGGNSLKIIELTARLGQVLNRDIPVVELFKYQTIDTFSVYLSGMNGSPVLETRSHLIERAKTKQELQKERRRK